MSDGVECTLDRPGATIAFTDAGRGPAVVRAHGLFASRERERRFGLDWSALESGRRLVSYDARGHGRSTGEPDPRSYRWSELGADLIALAREVSPEKPVDAVGASMGCATVLHAAAQRPDVFRRLVLVIPPAAWESRVPDEAMYNAGATLVEQLGAGAFVGLCRKLPLPPVLAEMVDYEFAIDVSPELLPAVLRGAGASDLPPRDVVSQLEQPTLILAWSGDAGHPIATAEILAHELPAADLHVSHTFAEVQSWGEIAARHLAR